MGGFNVSIRYKVYVRRNSCIRGILVIREGFDVSETGWEKDLFHQKQCERGIRCFRNSKIGESHLAEMQEEHVYFGNYMKGLADYFPQTMIF